MSKRSFIDSIEVKKTCSEDWNAMTGSERVRFCGHCNLNVNNISALTRKQAMRLVREANGRICVRYVKNPVDNSPVFAGRLYQITRRASLAAGVLSATLAVSTLAYAQGKPALNKARTEISQTETADKDKSESASASISGTITDDNGVVFPNATVTIFNTKTNSKRVVSANETGFYKFENVAAGKYKVEAAYSQYKVAAVETDIFDSKEFIVNLSLEPSEETIVVTMGEVALISYSSPLSSAVSNDDIEIVKNLIARGENVNGKEKNYSHITPLFIAVENGSAEIAETLLNFGARVNARDDNRQTPLMRLDEDASAELASLLIKHGARVNLVDKAGNTALILASRGVNAEVLQILITRSANIDARNAAGRTALMEAADADNLENVRALLAAGADANLKDNDGETAFDLTTAAEIKMLLESYGAESAGAESD